MEKEDAGVLKIGRHRAYFSKWITPKERNEEVELLNAELIAAHRKKRIVAKSNIVLSLGPTPAAAVATAIDDDSMTVKDLWEELLKLYTTLNAQQILNLLREIEVLRLKDESEFNQHVNQLRDLVDKLPSLGKKLEDPRLVQYLLRSLPESLEGIAQVAVFYDNLTFEKLQQSIRTEIGGRNSSSSRTQTQQHSSTLEQHLSQIWPFRQLLAPTDLSWEEYIGDAAVEDCTATGTSPKIGAQGGHWDLEVELVDTVTWVPDIEYANINPKHKPVPDVANQDTLWGTVCIHDRTGIRIQIELGPW